MDAYTSTGQGILGNNMFAYCLNNPVNYCDESGNWPDNYAGRIGEELGKLIYEWLTGEDHPAREAEQYDRDIIHNQAECFLNRIESTLRRKACQVEHEVCTQINQNMAVIAHWEDTFRSPVRTMDFAAMAYGNISAYGSYVSFAVAPSVGAGVLLVVTVVFSIWSTLRYYGIISDWEETI